MESTMSRLRHRFALVILAGALLVASVSSPVAATTAHPDAPNSMLAGPGYYVSGVLGRGESWLGALAVNTGLATHPEALYYCIQSGLPAPTRPVTAQGVLADPSLAYVAWRYREANLDARAAVAYLFRVRHDMGTAQVDASTRRAAWERELHSQGQLAGVAELAASYLAQAQLWAGPYTAGALAVAPTREQQVPTGAGVVSGIGVQAKSGQWVAGLEYALTITGATLANGKTVMHSLTGSAPTSVDFTGASGEVTVAVQYTTPPVELVWGSTGEGTQAVAAAGGQGTATANLTASFPQPFGIEVSSDVVSPLLKPGDPLTDVVHVGAIGTWVEDVVLTLQVTSYGPVEQSAAATPAVPAHAPVHASKSVTVSKPGDVIVELGPVTQPGYYPIVVTYDPTGQAPGARWVQTPAFTTDFFDPRETSLVPFAPTIDTTAGVNGLTVTDEVVVASVPATRTPQEPAVVTHTLHGPFPQAPQKDSCEPGNVAFTTTSPLAPGPATITSGPLAPGWYTWVARVQAGGRIAAVTTTCGEPSETVELLPVPPTPPATPPPTPPATPPTTPPVTPPPAGQVPPPGAPPALPRTGGEVPTALIMLAGLALGLGCALRAGVAR